MLACRVAGHRLRFTTDGATMSWSCERGCGEAGAKTYPSAEDAERYAWAFDCEDREALGRRAPLGLLPPRFLRAVRRR